MGRKHRPILAWVRCGGDGLSGLAPRSLIQIQGYQAAYCLR